MLRSFNSFRLSYKIVLILNHRNLIPINRIDCCFLHRSLILCHFIPDKTFLPTLNEKDLEEQFVQGTGPGGQNVNRLQNCVVLKHIPTDFQFQGIVVKCHQDRFLHRNRSIARQILLQRLDEHLNGENSIKQQKIRYNKTKLELKKLQAEKLRSLKQQYKDKLSESNVEDHNEH
ncbi:hypothetical protein SSS_01775 [Sarcoptes scabiei]|nr:hypothetical protein SSS_01775 [Sarcoptes scabiei]